MLRRIVFSIQRLLSRENRKKYDQKIPWLSRDEHSSNLWFRGFLGETIGIYSDFRSLKTDLKGSIMLDDLKIPEPLLPESLDVLSSLQIELIEEAI